MKKIVTIIMTLTMMVTIVACGNNSTNVKENNYPENTVESLVGYAAGGASDIIARLVAQSLGDELGESVIVQNMEGAGGEIAYTALATEKADGYTLGYINAPATMSIPLSRKVNYKIDDFAFIGNVIYHENLIVVSSDGPYKNYEDLIKAAKENPGKLTLGNSGAYADDHLAALKWQFETKLELENTMFKGTAPSLVSLLGNHIDAVVCNVADIVQKSRDGQVVVIATMGAERNPLFPNAPTLTELGFDAVMGNYTTLAAPADTPAEVLSILRESLEKVCKSEEYIKSAEAAGLPIKYINADEIKAIYEKSNDDLEKLWNDLELPNS